MRTNASMVEAGELDAGLAFNPNAVAAPVRRAHKTSPLAGPPKHMTTLQKIRIIEQAIEEMRPFLRADGGDCELVDVEGDRVIVRLVGACVGCQMASVTVNGIQERLIAKLGHPLRVIPAPAGH